MPQEGSCIYNGKEYSEGSEICQAGRVMVCSGGTWSPTGANCTQSEDGQIISANNINEVSSTENKAR